MAEQQGVTLPANDEDGLAKAVHRGENCDDLEDYLKAFAVTLSVMQTEESLYRCAYELAEDAASENVRYMEVRYEDLVAHPIPLLQRTIAFADLDWSYRFEGHV